MPLFSPDHHQELVHQFWTNRKACCPHDGTELDCHLYSNKGGYLLVLACNTCGKKTQATRFSDPQRISFRPWTEEEVAGLVKAHGEDESPSCPVCQTRALLRKIV